MVGTCEKRKAFRVNYHFSQRSFLPCCNVSTSLRQQLGCRFFHLHPTLKRHLEQLLPDFHDSLKHNEWKCRYGWLENWVTKLLCMFLSLLSSTFPCLQLYAKQILSLNNFIFKAKTKTSESFRSCKIKATKVDFISYSIIFLLLKTWVFFFHGNEFVIDLWLIGQFLSYACRSRPSVVTAAPPSLDVEEWARMITSADPSCTTTPAGGETGCWTETKRADWEWSPMWETATCLL